MIKVKINTSLLREHRNQSLLYQLQLKQQQSIKVEEVSFLSLQLQMLHVILSVDQQNSFYLQVLVGIPMYHQI